MMMSYELDKDLEKEIINYTRESLNFMDTGFFEQAHIRINNYFELVYDLCKTKYLSLGRYTLTQKEFMDVIDTLYNTELILKEFVNGKRKLIGVRDNDYLILK